jgi:hypothetical protein
MHGRTDREIRREDFIEFVKLIFHLPRYYAIALYRTIYYLLGLTEKIAGFPPLTVLTFLFNQQVYILRLHYLMPYMLPPDVNFEDELIITTIFSKESRRI